MTIHENHIAPMMKRTEEVEIKHIPDEYCNHIIKSVSQANGIGFCTGNLHAYRDMLKLIESYDDGSNPKDCSAMLDAIRKYVEQQIGYWDDARKEWD